VLNSVFMHHCVEAGLDMAIVNPAHITPYAEIDEEQRRLADDLIFDRGEDALAKFIAFYEAHTVEEAEAGDPTEGMAPDEADPLEDPAPEEGRDRGVDRGGDRGRVNGREREREAFTGAGTFTGVAGGR
jgi:hypothetical protein